MNRLSSTSGAARARALVVLLVLTCGASAWAAPPALSPDQQRRLDAGEIVVLETLPPGASASAQGGTAIARVCAAPGTVWDILVDWPGHTALYPRVTASEVIHRDAARVRVRYTVTIGPFAFDAYIDKYPDAARRRSTWRLAEDRPGSFFSESSGFWQVDEADAGSLVTHGVGTRTIVPAFLTRGSQRESLVSTVKALRARAQKNATPCAKPAP